jgi:hypothetical protein
MEELEFTKKVIKTEDYTYIVLVPECKTDVVGVMRVSLEDGSCSTLVLNDSDFSLNLERVNNEMNDIKNEGVDKNETKYKG